MSENGSAPQSAFQAYQTKSAEKKKNISNGSDIGSSAYQTYQKTAVMKKKKKDKKIRRSMEKLRQRTADAVKTPPPSISKPPPSIKKKMTKEEKIANKKKLKAQAKYERWQALKPEKQYILSGKINVPVSEANPRYVRPKASVDNGADPAHITKKRTSENCDGNASKKKKNLSVKSKFPRYFVNPVDSDEEPSIVLPKSKKINTFETSNGNEERDLLDNDTDSSDDEIPILVEVKRDVQIVSLDENDETELVTGETTFENVSRVHLDEDNESSVDKGKELLENIIAPMKLHTFLQDFWEKTPVVVKRNKSDYFSQLDLTSESLDAMLRKNHLRFTKNIDITTYRDGKRETLNPPGRATPAEVWDYYNDGASVRWINPQTFSSRLWLFCSTLQEYFGCFVGANLYLTPPNTQGFAPHYDDIEAFILQLEGSKHWKLYHPRSDGEVLPRYSSGNFDRGEIGEPFMEVTLEAGDLLYFPRGVIHEAVAGDTHSLHATLSVYQRNAWADLMEKLVPAALSAAIADDVRLRRGLPIGFLSCAGAAHAESADGRRAAFVQQAHDLARTVLDWIDVDAAVDQMGLRFMQDALPPVLTEEERACSMVDDGDRMTGDGVVINSWAMDKRTRVKLARAHCVRLVYELGTPKLYYNLDNTREYHEEEPGFFEIAPEMVPCVMKLIESYPKFIAINSLPLESMEQKVDFAGGLWIKGLLLTDKPVGEDNQGEHDDDDDENEDDDDEVSSDDVNLE